MSNFRARFHSKLVPFTEYNFFILMKMGKPNAKSDSRVNRPLHPMSILCILDIYGLRTCCLLPDVVLKDALVCDASFDKAEESLGVNFRGCRAVISRKILERF